MVDEVWMDIPGFEDCYQVSNIGRVRSKNRTVRHNFGGYKKVSGKIKKQLLTTNNRKQVHLYKNGKRTICSVHRLVLLAFVGECPKGMEVRHLNSIPTDNRLCNLAYGTHSENVIDIANLGRLARQKLNPSIVIEIRERVKRGERVKDLAAEYGVGTKAITNIKHYHTYSWL